MPLIPISEGIKPETVIVVEKAAPAVFQICSALPSVTVSGPNTTFMIASTNVAKVIL